MTIETNVTPQSLVKSPVVAAAFIIALAILIYGCMSRYEGVGEAGALDRWTGEVCRGAQCWMDGEQTNSAS